MTQIWCLSQHLRPQRDGEMNCFSIPVSRVMARLFKTVVNIGLLLPIYFVPGDLTAWCVVLLYWSSDPFNSLVCIICLKFPLCLCVSVRVQPCCLAFRAGQEGALMWRICNRSPLPGEWCHYDRDGQLRPNRRQDLWRWPIPDGERQLLPPRCLQDYITKVKRWAEEGSYFTNKTRSWQHYELLFFLFPSATNISAHKRNA